MPENVNQDTSPAPTATPTPAAPSEGTGTASTLPVVTGGIQKTTPVNPRRGKQYRCSHCQMYGHNQKTCPARKAVANGEETPNSDGPGPGSPPATFEAAIRDGLIICPSPPNLRTPGAVPILPRTRQTPDGGSSARGEPTPDMTRENDAQQHSKQHQVHLQSQLQVRPQTQLQTQPRHQQPQLSPRASFPSPVGPHPNNELFATSPLPMPASVQTPLNAAPRPQSERIADLPLDAALNAARGRVLAAEIALAKASTEKDFESATVTLEKRVRALEQVVACAQRCAAAVRAYNGV
jgi:hypothetical protein